MCRGYRPATLIGTAERSPARRCTRGTPMVMVSPGPPASGSQADTPTRAVEEAPAGLVAGTRGLLAAFAGLTSLAVLALLVFSANARHAFAWSIHMELTAAFLGAAY